MIDYEESILKKNIYIKFPIIIFLINNLKIKHLHYTKNNKINKFLLKNIYIYI